MENLNTETRIPPAVYRYSYLRDGTGKNIIEKGISNLREKIAPFRFRLAAENIVHELDITSDSKVLELGSGLGLLGKAIKNVAGTNLSYFGVDYVFDSARKSTGKQIIPLQANAINLPFATESFDFIVSTDVLEHIPSAENAVKEMRRVTKKGGKAFVVIADPSEGRFDYVSDHINRIQGRTDVTFWQDLFIKNGFELLLNSSEKYRGRDWRQIFNLPLLVRLKDKPGFACAFNPVNRPGTYILKKP